MLYTLAVILLIAWLLGVVGTYTIGAFVHARARIVSAKTVGNRFVRRGPLFAVS